MTHTYGVKAIKTFRGHDGYGYSCSLTRNGKKVAEVLDDGWGGGLQISWVDGRKDETVEYTCRNYKDEYNCIQICKLKRCKYTVIYKTADS